MKKILHKVLARIEKLKKEINQIMGL